MMNTHKPTGHTEIDYPSSNAMEQAALLQARCALARWRCCDLLYTADDGGVGSAREEWYAALEQRMIEWIARGGLAQDGESSLTARCLSGQAS